MGIERESNLVFYAQSTSTGDQRERERALHVCRQAEKKKEEKDRIPVWPSGKALGW